MIYAWHIHHEDLVEGLSEPMRNRIRYVRMQKPREEIPLRLRLFKRVKDQKRLREILAKTEYNYAKILDNRLPLSARRQVHALHAKECPDCTFVGDSRRRVQFPMQGTIFSSKAKMKNGQYV